MGLWIALAVGLGLLAAWALAIVAFYIYVHIRYLDYVVRILQETPPLACAAGEAIPGEDIRFPTTSGLTLSGCYLKTPASQRLGVILFGIEFRSSRWSCVPYCRLLLDSGFDVFAFEYRNQGESDSQPGYEPLQWVTDHETADMQSALAYLKGRADADPAGIGFYGISKGAGAGIQGLAGDPYVRCFVTDGAFATCTTTVAYIWKWFRIYLSNPLLRAFLRSLPEAFLRCVTRAAMHKVDKARGCRLVHLEKAIGRLAPRPLLMVHGGADAYIRPEMAQAVFARARNPKEFWLVEGAKHNQAINQDSSYNQRILEFFRTHLQVRQFAANHKPLPANHSPRMAE